MRKELTMSGNCRECVFYRKRCVLGHKRPWNSLSCDDFQPYCLVCSFPDEFCNTCRIMAARRMKPLDMDLKPPAQHHIEPVRYDCVWLGH